MVTAGKEIVKMSYYREHLAEISVELLGLFKTQNGLKPLGSNFSRPGVGCMCEKCLQKKKNISHMSRVSGRDSNPH